MIKDFTTLKGASWHDSIIHEVSLIGLGSIGSWLALMLARSNNFNILAYDFDIYEEKNLNGQFAQQSNIGKDKTKATSQNLRDFAQFENFIAMEKFTEDSFATPIMFLAPDNEEVRKLAFKKWKELPDRLIFIDGRMDFEIFDIHAIIKGTDKEIDYAEQTLKIPFKSSTPICTLSSTSHVASTISNLMLGIFNNWNANNNGDIRPIPKLIKYSFETMSQNTWYYDI